MVKHTRVPAPALHPLVADVVGMLDLSTEAKRLRDDVLRRRFDALNPRDSHGANLLAVAASVLATSHLLDDRVEPFVGAQAFVEHVHRRREVLLPDVASLLGEVRDRVALEDGRRAFVSRAREVLQAVEAMAADVFDVRDERVIVIGGRNVPIAYERNGERRTRVASLVNQEGRLLALLLTGRGPRGGVTDPVLVSRLRTGLSAVVGDQVRLIGDPLRLEPPLRLTARARAAASQVRSVKRTTS